MSKNDKLRPSCASGPTVWDFLLGILTDTLRFLLTSVGIMVAGAIAGVGIGGVAALNFGFPIGTGLLIGAVAGFLLAVLALAVVHGGW
ncbi:hypothetical protein [Marimonas lutisalis]|uniref:hypothetical protein n=1 Tax=Marimonas lutisalis TaxID=2545756 RepID=UPI0010F942D2|nr:hypothetical protein [Marimonas lutisalis]